MVKKEVRNSITKKIFCLGWSVWVGPLLELELTAFHFASSKIVCRYTSKINMYISPA